MDALTIIAIALMVCLVVMWIYYGKLTNEIIKQQAHEVTELRAVVSKAYSDGFLDGQSDVLNQLKEAEK